MTTDTATYTTTEISLAKRRRRGWRRAHPLRVCHPAALEQVWPATRHQRCTVHETANVIDNTRLAAAEGENQLPKAVQSVICRDGVEVINTLNQSAAATVSSKVQHSSRHDAARLSAARGLGADGKRGAGIRVDVKHWPSPSRRGARHALEAVSIIRGGQACRISTMIRDQAVRGRRKGEHP